MMYLMIIIGIAIVAIEIIIDKKLWGLGIDDKRITTAGRGVLIVIPALVLPNPFGLNISLITATFFLLFDFSLNVSRWGDLPIPYYQPFDSANREFRKMGHSLLISRLLAYDQLSTWQKIVYNVNKFTKRFFWHGDEETKSYYDLAFQRGIPPIMELMIKGSAFGIAVYYY